MKKLRLRSWVKITLVIIVTFGLLVLNYISTEKAIDQCIKGGQEPRICEMGLR